MDMRVDEKGKYFTPRIAKDVVVAFLRTRDQVIVGSIYVRPGNRLTDELNSDAAPFLAVTDAHVFSAADETLQYRAGLLIVAFRTIVLIGELDAMADIRPAPWQTIQPEHEPQPPQTDPGLRVDEKGKFFSLRVPKDAMAVVATTENLLIAGYLHLRPDRRLRDELNSAKSRFLPVTEPQVFSADGRTQYYHASFLLVASDHLVAVSPAVSLSYPQPAPWLETIGQE